MDKVEVFKLADGTTAAQGLVVKNKIDCERGVITKIFRDGDAKIDGLECIGTMRIQNHPGMYYCTNKHKDWLPVPKDKQTPKERFYSWFYSPGHYTDEFGLSVDEEKAIDGILSLLPEHPNETELDRVISIEDALDCLADYMTRLLVDNVLDEIAVAKGEK